MISPTTTEAERVQSARCRLRAASQQARADVGALLDCPGELDITGAEDLELFYLAAVLLHSQDRIDQVLASGEFKLHRCELIWAALAPHIQSAGYELGKRYMPGWTNNDQMPEGTAPLQYLKEHPETQCLSFRAARVIHARHHSSGRQVVLKIVCTRPGTIGEEELDILQYLNSPQLRNSPANAAVHLLDVLDFPSVPSENELARDFHVVVMPALDRVVISQCYILAYALDLMRQAFRAVAFLHSHGICHRDMARRNLMVSRDSPPFRLHLIDFGRSFRIKDSDPARIVGSTRAPWIGGQIEVLPESEAEPPALHNPFQAEIYALARTWQLFLSEWPPTVHALLTRMTDSDPDARPTATEALYQLNCAMAKLSLREQKRPVRPVSRKLMNSCCDPALQEATQSAQFKFLMSRMRTDRLRQPS